MSARRAELLSYLVAAAILIGLGAVVRTPILNWVCGPGIVIAVVSLLPPLLSEEAREHKGTKS